MAIVRWDPFGGLLPNRDNFNRFFNEALTNFMNAEEPTQKKGWAPPVDIYETAQSLVLKSELPGIDPKDVEVRIDNGTLYLKGERKQEKDVKEEHYHRVERSYGSFMRTFTLPSSVDTDNVKAEYKDGVLTLTLAKKEEAKPKTIKINVTQSSQAAASGK